MEMIKIYQWGQKAQLCYTQHIYKLIPEMVEKCKKIEGFHIFRVSKAKKCNFVVQLSDAATWWSYVVLLEFQQYHSDKDKYPTTDVNERM